MNEEQLIEVSADFVDLLQVRIIDLRPSVEIDPDKQHRGYRFKNDDCNIDMILTSVIMANQKPRPTNVPIQPNAVGLQFNIEDVENGKYDLIIKETLSSLSCLDYVGEHRVDFH